MSARWVGGGGARSAVESDTARLAAWVASRRRLLVLTGAGCSTESGIPDYRDGNGNWKRTPPVQLGEFIGSEPARKRYWARSLLGWPQVSGAAPNAAHRALARLEALGRVHHLITQNVDGLHQKAGSRRVIDLHGRLDVVECLGCRGTLPRATFQDSLLERNPGWKALAVKGAPDGDADISGADYSGFRVPPCPACSGVLKPQVVFFGENVPRGRVLQGLGCLEAADAVMVVGSSLMVWSIYRFVRAAVQARIPMAAVNIGRTRADPDLDLKVEASCGEVLLEVVRVLE